MPRNNKTELPPYLRNPRSSLPYVFPIPPKLPSGAATPINVKPEVPSVSPPPMQLPPQQTPTLMDSVKQGFGFGIGTSIARSIFGGGDSKTERPNAMKEETARAPHIEDFLKCMQDTDNNMDACRHILMNDNKV